VVTAAIDPSRGPKFA